MKKTLAGRAAPSHTAGMELDGATLKAGALSLPISSGRIRSVDAVSGEVCGVFFLERNADLPRGVPGYSILSALQRFDVRLLTSKRESSGVKSYRFVARCAPEAVGAMDLLLNPTKHPTLLEQFMH